MYKVFRVFCLLVVTVLVSCHSTTKERSHTIIKVVIHQVKRDTVIIDCRYTFDEAIAGTKAPQTIIDQLQLFGVQYYSTDRKIHQGQILANKQMVPKLIAMFQFMKQTKFPIVHAIPIVKYNWDDDLSMNDNNTYSFCYRNQGYSKHAIGMAIDINPFFNPLRWKEGFTNRQNKPIEASYNPSVPGTFSESNPVVVEFMKNGFHWGHYFPKKFDDHHFEL